MDKLVDKLAEVLIGKIVPTVASDNDPDDPTSLLEGIQDALRQQTSALDNMEKLSQLLIGRPNGGQGGTASMLDGIHNIVQEQTSSIGNTVSIIGSAVYTDDSGMPTMRIGQNNPNNLLTGSITPGAAYSAPGMAALQNAKFTDNKSNTYDVAATLIVGPSNKSGFSIPAPLGTLRVVTTTDRSDRFSLDAQ